MDMGWGGTVDWTPEAKVRIAPATTDISRRLEVDEETADRLWEAMSDVYELMAGQGLCAYPGGEQSVRVIPEALEFIRSRADAYARSAGLIPRRIRRHARDDAGIGHRGVSIRLMDR
jgi:hypothetical protein